MQKKYIYIIIILIINSISVTFFFYTFKDDSYSDGFVNTLTEKVTTNINQRINATLNNINTIKNDITSPQNKSYYDNYFTQFLNQHKNIDDILLIDPEKIYVIARDNNTYITTIDTTEEIDIIKWTRIESNKTIGEWDQIFSIDSKSDSLIKRLRENQHQVIVNIGSSKLNGKISEHISYVTHWKTNNTPFNIVLRHNDRKIFKFLTSIQNIKDANLIISNPKKNNFFISANDSIFTEEITESNNNSIAKTILNRYLKIRKNDSTIRVFSFKYKDDFYWSSIIQPQKEIGINFLIFTIPEYAIEEYLTSSNYLAIAILLLVFIGSIVILYFVIFRKRPPQQEVVDITHLLKQDENRFLEFKSSLRWDYRQEKPNPKLEMVIVKTIAAFGNSDGGHLLIGVDDDKKILGLENDFNSLKKKDADYFEIYLRNILHQVFGVKYTTNYVRITFPTVEHKEICAIQIFKANEPAYIKTKDKSGNIIEKFYVRSGNSSQELSSLQDINDYIFDRFKTKK